MPADIVSLSKARKAKARTDREAAADRNRVLFGRTKAERAAAEKMTEINRRRLDGHALSKMPDESALTDRTKKR